MTDINKFWFALFYWYFRNKREFPWRNTDSAYKILIAEVLLQQTHVRKVESVYEYITNRYPTLHALAAADIRDLKLAIQPLGLKYRADRLLKTAEIVCYKHNGQFPEDKKSLVALPGVGDYIAEAVRCYAFRLPTIPIDTNVIRLFTRYFGLVSSKTRARCDRELLRDIRSYYMFKNTRLPNLAVLDFASTICTAKAPACDKCLINKECVAKNANMSCGE